MNARSSEDESTYMVARVVFNTYVDYQNKRQRYACVQDQHRDECSPPATVAQYPRHELVTQPPHEPFGHRDIRRRMLR